MKKIIMIICLSVPMLLFAQDKSESENNDRPIFSVSYRVSDSNYIGVSYEAPTTSKTAAFRFNFGFGQMNISQGGADYKGIQKEIGYGLRFYLSKNPGYSKIYVESLLTYGRVKFSEPTYSGIYQYLSPINASIGYKLRMGQKFTIDPSVGFMWRIEIMSREDVDNRSFDNLIGNAGMKLGYQF